MQEDITSFITGAKKLNFYPFAAPSTPNLNLVTRQIIIPFRSYYAA